MTVGLARLRRKLADKRDGVLKRYSYYDAKPPWPTSGVDFPLKFRHLGAVLGWCTTAVDSMADRLVFREFKNDVFDLNQIFRMNSQDVLCNSAILAALIGGCSFIYIAPDDAGFPRMRALDALDATGMIDPVTHMLNEGYAVLERDDNKNPVLEAYFLPGSTTFYPKGGLPYTVDNIAPYPLLVPIINRPDATRAFGHSRITRACMDLTQSAMRTLRRSEIAAEFYSYPQRYILGMSPDAEQFDKWQGAVAAILRIDKDEDDQHPTVGQFHVASMTPFGDQLRLIAGAFAGETGLIIDDLGFSGANPASADAIKASHERLRLSVTKCQHTFGTGFLNAGYLAACIRDEYPYLRQQLYDTRPKFEPIFDVDISKLGALGDAIYKIQQSYPDYFTEEKLQDLTGI